MISILIPVLNYNISSLVEELHKQLLVENIEFEILFFEDGSNQEFISKNRILSQLSKVKQLISNENVGRIKARKILTNSSKYDWLLFLDADVLPKDQSFVHNYISYFKTDYDAVYGGITYDTVIPKPNQVLRWKYGIKYEEVSSEVRNKKPFKVIFSANCLMKKSVFNKLNLPENNKTYGIDSLIGDRLSETQSKILHINNQVIHLGLEDSATFLSKKEQASKVLLEIYHEKKMNSNPENSLLSVFSKTKLIGLNYLISWIYQVFKKQMRKNLLSRNPNMLLFQFYRLSHLCYTNLNSR